jgi:hypothetical protein
MSLKTAVKRLERVSRQNEDTVIVTYLPDWNDPNYMIVNQAGKENERITREEHRRRIAEAKANGIPVYGIKPPEEELL